MRPWILYPAFLAVTVVAILVWNARLRDQAPAHRPRDEARVEPTPLVPWRNPEADLAQLFPPSAQHLVESRILSGVMGPIQRRLGRPMHPDENPLRIHRVRRDGRTLGSVLVTRVRGEFGGIELVVAVETNGVVRGVLVQGHREPPEVAMALTNRSWLGAFAGKRDGAALRLGVDLPDVAPVAARSARAMADGLRDLLLVLGFAEASAEVREGLAPAVPHH